MRTDLCVVDTFVADAGVGAGASVLELVESGCDVRADQSDDIGGYRIPATREGDCHDRRDASEGAPRLFAVECGSEEPPVVDGLAVDEHLGNASDGPAWQVEFPGLFSGDVDGPFAEGDRTAGGRADGFGDRVEQTGCRLLIGHFDAVMFQVVQGG